MAEDPSIALHRVPGSEFRYELSGLRTGSIRDQILRAQQLVLALKEAGKISKSLRLLVLGGGAAGVTAALTACKAGVHTVLVERTATPFFTQLNASSRVADPVEFDWPQPHWRTGRMDWDHQVYPLPYAREEAHVLAAHWTQFLQVFFQYGPLPATVDFMHGLDANSLITREEASGFRVDNLGYFGPMMFGAAISCIGFSGEKTSLQASSGMMVAPLFWGPDDLGAPFAGSSRTTSGAARVLISGGGDGAQQDFLRVATGEFGVTLYTQMGLPPVLNLSSIILADDAARRVHAWSHPRKPPKKAQATWHNAYVRLAEDIFKHWKQSGLLPQKIKLLRADVLPYWVVGGDQPGYCYGLNRLLSLIVAQLVAERDGIPATSRSGQSRLGVAIFGCKVTRVAPIAHSQCDDHCHSDGHSVFVSDTSGNETLLGDFDVIVVRHGVRQAPYFQPGAAVLDQIVPMQAPR